MEPLLNHPNWTLAFASTITMGAGTPRSSLVAAITALLPSTPSVAGIVAIFRDETAGITITAVALLVVVVNIAKFG